MTNKKKKMSSLNLSIWTKIIYDPYSMWKMNINSNI